MLLSIGHGEFPDLNFRLAPSCPLEGKPSILIMNKPLKQPLTQNAFRPLYFFENIAAGPQNIIPKKGEIKILENNIEEISKEKSLKKIFEVSYEVNHDTYSDISTQHSVDLNYNYNCNFNFITENDITKFNNDEKLKKIHSTYHLKRKSFNFLIGSFSPYFSLISLINSIIFEFFIFKLLPAHWISSFKYLSKVQFFIFLKLSILTSSRNIFENTAK